MRKPRRAGQRTVFPLTSVNLDEARRSAPVVGYGKSFASFGEIVQGRTSGGEDFLVTLPIDMWSACELVCSPINGPLVVECRLEKSRAVLYHVLSEIGIHRGFHIQCDFTRNIPIGKGLSSSTADMLATLRAIQEVFGFLLTESYISKTFAEIEPHDGLHFNASVMYNHRSGRLIENFGYVPQFTIIAIDDGGEVDTVDYNRKLAFTDKLMQRFDVLLERLRCAYTRRDDREIAACATESARCHLERTGNELLKEVLLRGAVFAPLGIVATHSGTCAGFLYPRDVPAREIERLTAELQYAFGRAVFTVRTLRLLL
jgi:uncharacterized protein involved in propanediol utilization